ncbi:SWI/SNF-related matrix-associated actin-dependent regulator of chromatin subfamily A-like protein 1 isoform X2 [Octopus bimaculoides]|uniref:SWI/SNF-related matrix-associated actin-dependent regulator of chromatin subfamily A-like protein 1 n=1 Tax=Octopus bimaculoides TaxID=37653 RepID=A0A0L8IGD6_OCTBM|nr:SWI/SNF-related matrix-associated actin-dependent regulator of chromatin subfamily A-like protein 1 isoform X2 [Octopus bimaculoides]|eukprot:XP_014771023.1 PREDICTED: SWI/SNF-related matrix-associated actin-dependent regulator of chromatin subfamily A-like protein 1 isoform X2 [Octopus bimaculoides]
MSSCLTSEQRKIIDENRQRALQKLAEKKAQVSPRPTPAHSVKSPSSQSVTSSGSVPQNNYAPKTQTVYKDGRMLPQKTNSFATSSRYSTFKSMPRKVIEAKFILESPSRFLVDVIFYQGLIDLFKTMETKQYDAVTKKWSFSLQEYHKLVKQAKVLEPDVKVVPLPSFIVQFFAHKMRTQQQQQQPSSSSSSSSSLPSSPTKSDIDLSKIDKCLRESLMPFQLEGVKLSIERRGRILFADEMGLGKTLQAISVACYYRNEWPLLIVVPSSVRFDWAQQIRRWVPSLDPQEINVILKGKDSGVSGMVNILSYDLMSKKSNELLTKKFKIVIMDESHFLKNFKSARTKAALPLLQNATRVILLTGTPALSRPSELFTQIVGVLRPINFTEYGLRYCDGKKNAWGWDFSGYSNLAELQVFMEEKVMIRRMKKDVLSQLPSKRRQAVLLNPNAIKTDASMKKVSALVEKSTSAERRNLLFRYFQETASAKSSAVCDYITDRVEAGQKFLVFAHHCVMMDAIEKHVQNKCKIEYIRIDGKTTSQQRKFYCDQFQKHEDIRLAILSICAANAGLNLTAASLVIFAELFWNPGILVQAEDRVHRIGQMDSVNIHYLVATGTADDFIWPLIKNKLNILGKAGLSKDDFSETDTVLFQNPRQKTILQCFEESFIEESDLDDNSINDDDILDDKAAVSDGNLVSVQEKGTEKKQDSKRHQTEIASHFKITTPTKKDHEEVEDFSKEFDDDFDWLTDDIDWNDSSLDDSEPVVKKIKKEL